MFLKKHKLLVANREEIAVRILRTARRLGVRTVSVYTQVDATAAHVVLADEPVLCYRTSPIPYPTRKATPTSTTSCGYVAREQRLSSMYDFLSDNAGFARRLEEAGVKLSGPSAQAIEEMVLKHPARELAVRAGVPVVPLADSVEEEIEVAEGVGYPVMPTAIAGGGGMGLAACGHEAGLKEKFVSTQLRAKVIFHNAGGFIRILEAN